MSRATVFAAYRRGRRERGQSLVEFAVLVPVFMLILIGMLEFGLMFNHDLTLQYASREGARVGSALGCGANSNITTCDYALPNCTPTPSPGCDDVDKYIVAAVQRVLEASGSPINMAQIGSIIIFRATSTGGVVGSNTDTWTYSKGNGPTRQRAGARLRASGAPQRLGRRHARDVRHGDHRTAARASARALTRSASRSPTSTSTSPRWPR